MLSTRHAERISRAQTALGGLGGDWLLVAPSADFRWLTGAVARSTERLVALAVPRSGEPFCVLPRLEADSLAAECPWLELEVWDEQEDPFERLERRLELSRRPAVLVSDGMRTAPLLRLAGRTPCRPAAPALAPLRLVKDEAELGSMERAASHADRVIEDVADLIRPGMTEREVARLAIDGLESLGDTDPWVIVASGPNSALPHHQTSNRRIETDDVVLLDLGASTDGYGSDITRTLWLSEPSPEAAAVYETVERAQQAAIAVSCAGADPEAVDRAARTVIESAGFGRYFPHRTGHGVGLEVHEPPYLVQGNHEPLSAGMVHSIEPGIYLPERFGVRIEDLVVVEAGGARRLNHAAHDPRPRRLRS